MNTPSHAGNVVVGSNGIILLVASFTPVLSVFKKTTGRALFYTLCRKLFFRAYVWQLQSHEVELGPGLLIKPSS